ncbi:MAG: hypothetical protein WAW92_02735 [Minisyncoccia bacterium]
MNTPVVLVQSDTTENREFLLIARDCGFILGTDYRIVIDPLLLTNSYFDWKGIKTLVVGKVTSPDSVGEMLQEIGIGENHPQVKVVWYHIPNPPVKGVFPLVFGGPRPEFYPDLVHEIGEALRQAS